MLVLRFGYEKRYWASERIETAISLKSQWIEENTGSQGEKDPYITRLTTRMKEWVYLRIKPISRYRAVGVGVTDATMPTFPGSN